MTLNVVCLLVEFQSLLVWLSHLHTATFEVKLFKISEIGRKYDIECFIPTI